MQELENYINSYFGISGRKGKQIQDLFEYQEIPKGKMVIKAGVCCDQLSFVQPGTFVFLEAIGRKMLRNTFLRRVILSPELSSLMFRQPARVNFQALTPGLV